MASYENIQLKYLFLNLKVKTGSIAKEVTDPQYVSHTQKKHAKDAIVWLLSKMPHSTEEVADHFGMSNELAKHLLDELISGDMVDKAKGYPTRYKRRY
ncbi:hypothetical protein [Phosphitispora sp. TUW77]|uniref:hypothetical protein n=1 Tax=Phosphitispora sp. TUW77 TaxID=3152361 RepID=UPI003AB6E024